MNKPSKRATQLVLWALLAIIVLGIGLRAYELTARSLWFDEAFSWRLIQFSPSELIERDAADVHPPLYYLLLQPWSVVFGSSILALRSFSVALAGLTIAAAYLFTSEAFRSRAAGLTAALFLAVSGFQIQYAWEARMYTLGTFLVLLSSWFLIKAVRSSVAKEDKASYWLWFGYALTASAMIYVHYYALFTLVAQAVFAVGYLLLRTRGRIGEIISQRLTWHGLGAAALIAVAYAPWLPTFISQNSQVQDNFWIPRIGGWSIPDTFYRMLAPTSGIPQHTGVGWILLAALPIFFIVASWIILAASPRSRDTRDAALLTVSLAATPFVLSIVLSWLGQSLYQDRFFVFAHLAIVIILAVLVSRIMKSKIRYIAIAALTLGLLTTFAAFWLELDIKNRPGAHAATTLTYEQRGENDPVVVSSPFIYFAILHYAQEEHAGSPLPRLYSATGELEHFAGGPILTDDDVIGEEIFTAAESTLWMIDTTGFGSSPLQVPAPWLPVSTEPFTEVFGHQQSVFVTQYARP